MSKLTLSVDDRVVSRAKRYAQRHGVSISELVETYLDVLSSPPSLPRMNTPILDSLRGSIKRADIKDYKEHLVEKYR